MTPTETIQTKLQAIKTLAEAATPGPWAAHNGKVVQVSLPDFCFTVANCDYTDIIEREQRDANAAYMAAMDPTTARALVAALREAVEEIATAPHSHGCAWVKDWKQPCNCWKPIALAGLAAIIPEVGPAANPETPPK